MLRYMDEHCGRGASYWRGDGPQTQRARIVVSRQPHAWSASDRVRMWVEQREVGSNEARTICTAGMRKRTWQWKARSTTQHVHRRGVERGPVPTICASPQIRVLALHSVALYLTTNKVDVITTLFVSICLLEKVTIGFRIAFRAARPRH
jgi:hypothetical protein